MQDLGSGTIVITRDVYFGFPALYLELREGNLPGFPARNRGEEVPQLLCMFLGAREPAEISSSDSLETSRSSSDSDGGAGSSND